MSRPVRGYPFVPKSTAYLEPGQFWGIRLSDGRFGCCRVLGLRLRGEPNARTDFIAGLLNWVGAEPPTEASIAGAAVLDSGYTHVHAIRLDGGSILGIRALEADGIEVPAKVPSIWADRYPRLLAERLLPR